MISKKNMHSFFIVVIALVLEAFSINSFGANIICANDQNGTPIEIHTTGMLYVTPLVYLKSTDGVICEAYIQNNRLDLVKKPGHYDLIFTPYWNNDDTIEWVPNIGEKEINLMKAPMYIAVKYVPMK